MPTQPLNVFFCYAPEDEELCQDLEAHLKLLVRQGYITEISGRRIGAEARAEIERQMDRADLILLLVSADFLASDRLYEVELRRALARRAERPEDVLGVLLRPCDWAHGDLAGLEMEPIDPLKRVVVPLTAWPSRDDGLKRVAEEIRRRAQKRMGSLSLNPRSARPLAAPLG
jgi:hypothetical protein